MNAPSDSSGDKKGASMQGSIQTIIGVLVFINVSLSGWALNKIVNLAEALAAIEGNRFTAADGLVVWQEISAIRTELAAKADTNRVPPPEVIRWLERHDREIEALKKP